MAAVTSAVIAVVSVVASGVISHDRQVKQNRRIGAAQAAAKATADKQEGEARAEADADRRRRQAFVDRMNSSGAGGIDNNDTLNQPSGRLSRQANQPGQQTTGRGRLLGS